ncbi:PTB-containing, cubilin and LRP1-interacting protein-like [Branchiostoma floridae]|uniref:PTB-containing, cubilin and LRP1-interacting protein-like n=2 Tax=Branchiostoma floridae TaxID=7739 RepID=A0A9J7M351_BRAFL|nr:PTB-containing, cubilin and LRP1-interacting protein-like [Branchiostoma floridae]
MLLRKSLSLLTLRRGKDVEAIELSETEASRQKTRHVGFMVVYVGKVPLGDGVTPGPGCTEAAVAQLVGPAAANGNVEVPGRLDILPHGIRLSKTPEESDDDIGVQQQQQNQDTLTTFDLQRIAFCSADHKARNNVFSWVYREVGEVGRPVLECHAVLCESQRHAKFFALRLGHFFNSAWNQMARAEQSLRLLQEGRKIRRSSTQHECLGTSSTTTTTYPKAPHDHRDLDSSQTNGVAGKPTQNGAVVPTTGAHISAESGQDMLKNADIQHTSQNGVAEIFI